MCWTAVDRQCHGSEALSYYSRESTSWTAALSNGIIVRMINHTPMNALPYTTLYLSESKFQRWLVDWLLATRCASEHVLLE